MTKSVSQFIPKDVPLARVQAKVDRDLFLRTRALMKKQGQSWADIIEACLRLYCEEMKRK